MKNLSSLIAIALAIFILPALAAACMCPGGPSTVDAEFDGHQIVGVFKAVSIENKADPVKEGELPANFTRIIKFSVEKVFKGELKPGEEVTLTQRGFDCNKFFGAASVQQEFLFYLNTDPAKDAGWYVSGCSRSREAESATADLRWIESMGKARGRTRLSGALTQYFGAAAEGEKPRWETRPNMAVVVTGNGKTVRLKTDEHGVYEVYDLAPGKYRVAPARMKGYKTLQNENDEVELKPKAQAEKDYIYRIDNSVSGRVLDASGRGLEGVMVELIPAAGKRPDDLFKTVTTTPDGNFELTGVPAGSYLIVVNGDIKEPSAASATGKFYYPSAAAPEGASPIRIGPGEIIKDLVLTAPK
jgi:Carboxypeptidase regulatory-like domain